MRFNHLIFDAPGAESFLDLFQRQQSGEDIGDRLRAIRLTEPAHLSEWKRKFDGGRLLVRMLRAFAGTKLAVFSRPSDLRGRPSRFRMAAFGEAETAAVIERAYGEAGYLMFMPYTLSAAIQAFGGAFQAKGGGGAADIIASVSIDLRTPDTVAANLFFNHVSFLLFRVPLSAMADRRRLLETVRGQMYDQVKSGFPRALAESSLLMRIVPLPLLGRLLLMPLKGEFATFGFSAVGKGGYASRRFMEADVTNLFHMPLVPVPPGLGFVVNRYAGRMNAVVSYVDGMFTEEEAARLEADVRRGL